MVADSDHVRSFVPLVEFLGKVLGENHEVVLHDLSNIDASVIAIANGHVTNRSVGSPATDFVLRVRDDHPAEEQDFAVNYRGTMPGSSTVLTSSTFFIRKEGRIVGMLCINTDHTLLRQLETVVAGLVGVYLPSSAEGHVEENLVASVEEAANQVIRTLEQERATRASRFRLDDRIEAVRRLHERGFFQFKGSVQAICNQLGVSEPTAYRYIQTARAEQTRPAAGS
ncbi:MAG: PAS domain-containing protein [Tessaracoccus sp.]|uniref:helix-turn-helix transcriptional regulator n=1 Tax=Tessaracoccus sp. TaxID=1971211 RepID=UPI001EBF380F|nr:PAS domain-containing protein [Tessaracoccus sp.]MBK7821422.1 PAS domain-containing protein [Tessaracoccus sp.]